MSSYSTLRYSHSFWHALNCIALACSLLFISAQAVATVPGGFLENDETTVVRNLLTPTQIASFIPSRGIFTFPAPYNTQGVRITNSSDCGGQDCVDMIYSYWRNMSNSANSNTMYIFVGLDRNRGGQGPTLFSYDKTSDQLTEVGPLFDSSSPYSWDSGEGWYFSYSMPTKLYIPSGSKLLRYDVLNHTFETLFDSTTQFPNTVIHQANSSNDDDVHSATLQDANSYADLGCIAYKESTKQFFYYAAQGAFDECQIDKSGRYLVIKEKLPSDPCTSCDVDNLIVDLKTGTQTILTDKDGAGGHSDLGYGWYIAADNWNNDANAWRVWNLGQSPLQGGLVYHDLNWNVFEPSHISFENADPSTPISQQYACGGAANSTIAPHANEIVCFLLDPSIPVAQQQSLVVAPVMTDLNATGGNATCPGCEAYAKDPKGNIDPTGQYFFWVSNLGGNRMDAFMVKIPSQLLTASAVTTGDTTPPTVSVTAPTDGGSVSGTVTVSANATDNTSVASVQFQLDGSNLGAPVTQGPYSVAWDTTTAVVGSHILSAVATDSSGNTAQSSISVNVLATVTAPLISEVSSAVTGSSSATISWATDQLSNSQVVYGTTTSYGSSSTLDTTLILAHSVSLTGLAPGTVYHYAVESWNADGMKSVSADYTFTTATATIPSGSVTLQAHWSLDEGSGHTAHDVTGNGYNGKLINGPQWVNGITGTALAFNGSNSDVTVSSSTSLNAYPLSVSFWMKTGAVSGLYGLVNKYQAASMNGYQVFLNNGKLCAWYFRDSADYVWDGSGCTLAVDGFADSQWHLVTFVVNANGGTLYVDGAQRASQSWTGAAGPTTTSNALLFGDYPGTSNSSFLPGTLDDVRLYNGALSASQVADLYNSVPRVQPVAWTNLVNITASGNSLQKTGGCNGCEDATGISQQQITTSGYLEFTASETNTLRFVGLANVNAGIGATNMAYSMRLQAGAAEVREYGQYKADTTFVSGDVFRIALENGQINYYKNGTRFYTSSVVPPLPLQASVSIFNMGGTVTNAVISTR